MAVKKFIWEVPARLKQDRLIKFFRSFIKNYIATYMASTETPKAVSTSVVKGFEQVLQYLMISILGYPARWFHQDLISSNSGADGTPDEVTMRFVYVSVPNEPAIHLFRFLKEDGLIYIGANPYKSVDDIPDAVLSNVIWSAIHCLVSPINILPLIGGEKRKKGILSYKSPYIVALAKDFYKLLDKIILTYNAPSDENFYPNLEKTLKEAKGDFESSFVKNLRKLYDTARQNPAKVGFITSSFEDRDNSIKFTSLNGNTLKILYVFSNNPNDPVKGRIQLQWVTPEGEYLQTWVDALPDELSKFTAGWFLETVAQILLYLTSPIFHSEMAKVVK